MPRDPLEVVLDGMDRFIAREITGLVFEVSAELIEATPLDLGWARANWIPQVTTPYRANLKDVETTSGLASSLASSAESQLFSIAASYRIDQGPIFVSNNVPYIGRLNDGHSKQAPAGFVQFSIAKAVAAKRSGL